MAKAVFIQNPTSIYKDETGIRYHFPKMYLSTVEETIGDWVVFYEGKKGRFGYTSVQKVLGVRPDPDQEDHFFADLELGTLLQFETLVPRTDPHGIAYETMLRKPDGTPIRGGANASAVRRLADGDFFAIVEHGTLALDGPEALPRSDPEAHAPQGFAEPPLSAFDAEELVEDRQKILTNRKRRDASFGRMVKAAYGGQCAISGLMLKNGGGRMEVQAAHIRPVEHKGPDVVSNGVALSGTLHWMFDRGLISIAEDYSILVAHNKVSRETIDRLIAPEQRLILPKDPRHYPHPAYLKFHREIIYGNSEP